MRFILQPLQGKDKTMEVLYAYKRYTYADYASWDTEERYELIDGVPYLMAAPSDTHQKILVDLSRQIANFSVKETCVVRIAPYDVRLNAAGDSDGDVVQPDLVVICDRVKFDEKGCNGAPDVVKEDATVIS